MCLLETIFTRLQNHRNTRVSSWAI